MGFKLNEVNWTQYAQSSGFYGTNPTCAYNTGWLDTSKALSIAAWASYIGSNCRVNSPHMDIHGAFDTNNPILIFSGPPGATDSGFITMPASMAAIWAPGYYPYPFTRATWQTTPVSSYPGSTGLFLAWKG